MLCIIVTYNGMPWIDKCLDSLIQSSEPVDILVVDNGSTDGTFSFIREKFPQVHLIASKKNLGFGQANNIGLRQALEQGAPYTFLLNQDAWVEKDTLRDLRIAHRKNPEFGILSPMHLNGAGNALDNYFSQYLMQSDTKDWRPSGLNDLPDPPVILNSTFVNAAAWLVSKECLDRTGGFDPIFFHYGEDVNFAHRVLFHGFRIGIYTGARIYHDREQRIGKPLSAAALLKKDKIHFLNQACDIRKEGFAGLSLRRCLRYSLLTLIHLPDKNKLIHNFHMAATCLLSMPRIKKSRTAAAGYRSFLNPDPEPEI